MEIHDYFCKDDRIYWGKMAAGILPVCVKTGRILVGLRSFMVVEPHTYGIFGGKMDENESDPVLVAKREFEEECNYNGSMVIVDAYKFQSPNGHFTYFNFLGLVDEEFEPNLNWENDSAKWITLDEALELPNKHYGFDKLLQESHPLIRIYTVC